MNTFSSFYDGHGRLGNQIFQLGLMFSLQHRRGDPFYLPRDGQEIWRCFAVDVPATGPECTNRFQEEHGSCNYDPRVFEQPCGTEFSGYFQSYRYLEGCEDELRQLLRFHAEHRARAEALRFMLERKYRRPLVSIHVRRGDYVQPHTEWVWGNLAADGYYDRAVEQIGHDVTYVVFSDDVEWCRTSLGIEGAEFVDHDSWTSLCLMSRCDVNVIANSSYSWWAAFLNPGADVYAPSQWWAAADPPNDRQDDILMPTWRTIPSFTWITEPP